MGDTPRKRGHYVQQRKNTVIACVAGSQDFGVRYLYLPNKRYTDDEGKVRKGMLRHACYDDESGFAVEGSGESVALQIATHTLEQYAAAYEEGAWAGHVALILPKNAAIRVHSIRGLLKAGNDAEDVAEILADRVSEYYAMSDSQKEAITAFAEVMEYYLADENNIDVREYDAFNLKHWRLRVSDGVELKEGQELEFVKDSDDNIVALDGEVQLETNGQSYVGKHKVVLAADGRNADGTPKWCSRLSASVKASVSRTSRKCGIVSSVCSMLRMTSIRWKTSRRPKRSKSPLMRWRILPRTKLVREHHPQGW